MPREVSRDKIETIVIENWARLVRETAEERNDNLSVVQPFFPFEQTFPEVLDEIKNNSVRGLKFYRAMVIQLPWYVFKK